MIEVVAAVIEHEGKLLAFQRGPAKYSYVSNKFEFPGGKVEENENHRIALKRELHEELLVKADVKDFIATVAHSYPDFSIKMHCYLVHLEEYDGQLTEHLSYASVNLEDADSLDWIEADRPVLDILKKDFRHVFSN